MKQKLTCCFCGGDLKSTSEILAACDMGHVIPKNSAEKELELTDDESDVLVSLNRALQQSGGKRFCISEQLDMSLKEFIEMIAPNNIRFTRVYPGAGE